MKPASLNHARKVIKLVQNYKVTGVVVVFGALYLPLTAAYKLNLFEHIVVLFHYLLELVDNSEFVEATPVMMFVMVAVYVDLFCLRRKTRRQRDDVQQRIDVAQQRIQVMRETLVVVHHVVHNFLNNLQLFRFEAERSGALTPQSLQMFDDLIIETVQNIKDIEDRDAASEHVLSHAPATKDLAA
ncbi:MAG: hypothetical protein JKY27_02130 [Magnetovibrio sp.]|nr:hypothetical protein [Magnetovibrio sp.]